MLNGIPVTLGNCTLMRAFERRGRVAFSYPPEPSPGSRTRASALNNAQKNKCD